MVVGGLRLGQVQGEGEGDGDGEGEGEGEGRVRVMVRVRVRVRMRMRVMVRVPYPRTHAEARGAPCWPLQRIKHKWALWSQAHRHCMREPCRSHTLQPRAGGARGHRSKLCHFSVKTGSGEPARIR